MRLRKGLAFLKKSKTTRAVVVKTTVENTPDGDAYYPVVRFQTDKQEWITQQLKTGVAGVLPEGTEMTVIYDPQNPTHIEFKWVLIYFPLFFLAFGILMLIITVLNYLGILTLGAAAEG